MAFLVTNKSTLADSPYIIYDIGQNLLRDYKYIVRRPKRGGFYDSEEELIAIEALYTSKTIWGADGVSSRPVNLVHRLRLHFDLNPATDDIEIGELIISGKLYFETGPEPFYDGYKTTSWDYFREPAEEIGYLEGIAVNYWNGPKDTSLPNGAPAESNLLFSQSVNTNINVEDLINAFGNKETSRELISTLDEFLNPPDNYVHRLRRDYNGWYMYVSDPGHIDILTGQGWTDEGIMYKTAGEAGSPLHSFNRYVSPTFYTAIDYEKDVVSKTTNWHYEGISFHVYGHKDISHGMNVIPVYRYLNANTGIHLYSASDYEQQILNDSSEWLNEGIAWYGEAL